MPVDVATIARRLADAGFIVTLDLEVDAAGAAFLLQVNPRRLRNLRYELKGPRYRLAGGIALYRIADIAALDGASLYRPRASKQTPHHEETH